MHPAHLPTAELITSWPDFSPRLPLRILTSGCLARESCGYDGTSYGKHAVVAKLFGLPNVQVFNFCPEEFSFGTPRALCNIHGGDGFDVLDGPSIRRMYRTATRTTARASLSPSTFASAHEITQRSPAERPGQLGNLEMRLQRSVASYSFARYFDQGYYARKRTGTPLDHRIPAAHKSLAC